MPSTVPVPVPVAQSEPPTKGLVFRLREASPEGVSERASVSPAEALLPDAEVDALLRRVPPLHPETGAPVPSALPPRSLTPPRAGRVVAGVFPPAAAVDRPVAVLDGPLEVLRVAPSGDVSAASRVSITFSHPMVPLASHAALARQEVPATLTPQPRGSWRWVDTRTLVFEAAGGMPMATDYEVEIRAGTRALSGGRLAEAVRWRFSTPPLAVSSFYPAPSNATTATPVLLAAFNQRIDRDVVLGALRLEVNGEPRALRLATAEEISGDAALAERLGSLVDERWLAFRPEAPLPLDTGFSVTLAAGTPSAEGPKSMPAAVRWTLRTYGPMTVTGYGCAASRSEVEGCPPSSGLVVHFSNPIDEQAFTDGMLGLEPGVPSLETYVNDSDLYVRGDFRPSTLYRVAVSGVRDVHGQEMARPSARTFTTGGAGRWVRVPGYLTAVLDPASSRRVPIYSSNVDEIRLEVRAVTPEDWPAYLRARWKTPGTSLPGRIVISRTLRPEGRPDEVVETMLDLSPALQSGFGQLIVLAEAVEPATPGPGHFPWTSSTVGLTWIQSTQMALDAFSDDESVLAWVSALADGRPLGDVEVSSVGGAPVTTAADGLAELPRAWRQTSVLVARRGDDVAFLPINHGWQSVASGPRLSWYVFDGRRLFRPGEEARFKGWVRLHEAGKRGTLLPAASRPRTVRFTAFDERQREIGRGTVPVNGFGGFEVSLALPPTCGLGTAFVQLTAGGGLAADDAEYQHFFQVHEYRRPEFEVTAAADRAEHLVGETARLAVNAAYYSGGGLKGAPVTWTVSAQEGSFTPPGRREFSFGHWSPWWDAGYRRDRDVVPQRLRGTTDALGRHSLLVDLEAARPLVPMILAADAEVQDLNRQAWNASSRVLVHPAAVYVGLKTDRYFVEHGAPLDLDVIVSDLGGRAVAGRPVRIKVERVTWRRVGRSWREEAVDAGEQELVSGEEAVRRQVALPEPGTYRLTATVTDASGRSSETAVERWVIGAGATRLNAGEPRVEVEQVSLIPGRDEYRPGDTAEILVIPPFVPAEGLLTVRRSGIVHHERFRIERESAVVRVPVADAWTPNAHVQVDLVGAAEREDPSSTERRAAKRPALASGRIELSIPAVAQRLSVSAAAREPVTRPGAEAIVDVQVADARGAAAAGVEAAVVVVDEAVLALAGYELPDPVAAFFPSLDSGTSDDHSRLNVLGLASVEAGTLAEAVMVSAAPAGSALSEVAGAVPAIAARRDFRATALFAGSVVTDAAGRAEVRFSLPDTTTRYRVMAVAASEGIQFGAVSESTITARLPLAVRLSPPRFMNLGDRVQLPVVIQNSTEAAMDVDVAVRVDHAELGGGRGRRVHVPANDRVELQFPVSAVLPGFARVQVAAAAADLTDAAELAVPVRLPATTQAFATYGRMDSDEGAVAYRLAAPADALPQHGGLQISTSSTALHALTDAALYLVSYRFNCAEQLASRVLAVAALKDVLSAFGSTGLPEPRDLEARVQQDLDTLVGLQNEKGEVGLWSRDDRPWPFVSIHAAHAFVRARANGFTVPDEALDRSRSLLRVIETRVPQAYHPADRRALVAYALYVRALAGERDAAGARALIATAGGVQGMTPECLGWLLSVLAGDRNSTGEVAAILRFLWNHATETASTAQFALPQAAGTTHLTFASTRRGDAVLLEGLVGAAASNDLVPKLVEGLLAQRTAGRWESTQENVFALLALHGYFQRHERVTPDFVARAWLGGRLALEHPFEGRTTDRYEVTVPMKALVTTSPSAELLIAKEGPGALYYRLGLDYAPRDLRLPALARGFEVERGYEAVDDEGDVWRTADGTWHVRAGSRVRVRVSLTVPARRYHVALVAPLPAGLEALDPSLKGTNATDPAGDQPDATPRERAAWWWDGAWYEHQELHDDRAEAFTSLAQEGFYSYSYLARATTPGDFIVPPATAEEMYHPETFGRSATGRLVVEAVR